MSSTSGYRSTAKERREAKARSKARIEERNREWAALPFDEFLDAYRTVAIIADEPDAETLAWWRRKFADEREKYGIS